MLQPILPQLKVLWLLEFASAGKSCKCIVFWCNCTLDCSANYVLLLFLPSYGKQKQKLKWTDLLLPIEAWLIDGISIEGLLSTSTSGSPSASVSLLHQISGNIHNSDACSYVDCLPDLLHRCKMWQGISMALARELTSFFFNSAFGYQYAKAILFSSASSSHQLFPIRIKDKKKQFWILNRIWMNLSA